VRFENRRSSPRYIYAFTDWGATMGNWGNVARRNIWNCEAFADDTKQFVEREKNGGIDWGYRGQHNDSFSGDIRASDVQWILRYVGRIRDRTVPGRPHRERRNRRGSCLLYTGAARAY